MSRYRLHARRTIRFLGLSRRSLVALALLGAGFALGRLALDAILPAAAQASQAPSSVATPALVSANPIEGGVAAFDDGFAVFPVGATDPDFNFTFAPVSDAPLDHGAGDTRYVVFSSKELPAPPVSVSHTSPSSDFEVACRGQSAAQRSERIVRLTGDFSRACERIARVPSDKELIESLRQARRAAHSLRAEHALPTPGTRLFPLQPERSTLSPSAAAPVRESDGALPTWLISIAAWILAGF